MIQQKLQALESSGALSSHQEQIAQKARDKILHPTPVSGLQPTHTPHSWLYDPTLTVFQDIKDHKGRLIAFKGQQINPLSMFSWGSPLLLLNGEDAAQIAWAFSQDKQSKWVLMKGSPLDLEQQTGRPVYFDQGGRLSQRFKISQIPCRISQQGKKLLIEEVLPELVSASLSAEAPILSPSVSTLKE